MNRELNVAENNLRLKMAGHARNLTIQAGLPDPVDQPLTPEVLDHLWVNWDWQEQLAESDQRIAVAFLGFAFGEYIAQQTGMKWCIVSDEDGDDYALIAASGATTFPLATVAKRYAGPKLFASIAPALVRDISSTATRTNA